MDREVWIYSMASTVSLFHVMWFFLWSYIKKKILRNGWGDVCKKMEPHLNILLTAKDIFELILL